MSKAKLRDTGNHAEPVRANRALAELMWEDGDHFKLVPRVSDGRRWAELCAMDAEGQEVVLTLDTGSLRIMRKEVARLSEWVESET